MTKNPLPNVEILDVRHLPTKSPTDPIAAVLLKVGYATYHGVRFYRDGTLKFPPWKEYGGGTIPVVQYPPEIHSLIEKDLQKAWVFFEKEAHSAFSR